MNKFFKVFEAFFDSWIVLFKLNPGLMSVLIIWNIGFYISVLKGNSFISSLTWGIFLKEDAFEGKHDAI